jgi:hypothetical protein
MEGEVMVTHFWMKILMSTCLQLEGVVGEEEKEVLGWSRS